MKQYIYDSKVVGLAEWPSGTLRLEGVEVTDDPTQADVFTVPGALTSIFPTTKHLYRLPYFYGKEQRHVFFDVSDNEQLYDVPAIFLRCNVRTWYAQRDPNSVSMAWPVTDFKECVELPAGGFKYDITSHAWDSSETRKRAAESCQNMTELKSDIIRRDHFTGYVGTPGHPMYNQAEFDRRMVDYKRSLKESRIALCGESIPGVFPYRFFEAMSAGRVPFLVSSDYVFPFADEIPYDSFILKCRRDEASKAGEIAKEFLKLGDDALIEKGRQARYWWEKLLNSADWPKIHAYAVLRKLNQLHGTASLACG